MEELLNLVDSNNHIVISYDSENNPYSYYHHDKWFLWSLGFDISFSRLSGDFKSVVKSVVYKILSTNDLKSKKSAAKAMIEGGVVFEQCIKSCGGDSYALIDDEKFYRSILIEAKNKGFKYKTWKNILMFITRIYNDGFISRDIGGAEKLASYLAINGENSSQAICIPESIAAAYYSEALRIVDTYHPFRKQISSCYREFTSAYMDIRRKYKSNITARKHAINSISHPFWHFDIKFDHGGSWLSWIRGACYTVIAGFTGCRDGEIKSFNIFSYQEKKYSGNIIPVLHGIDTKPNLGGVARHNSWVTIPSVKKAIDILWDAFNFAREVWREKAESISHPDEKNAMHRKIDSLFVNLSFKYGHRPDAGRQALAGSLESFVKSVGYLATKNDVLEFDLLNPTRKGELKIGKVLKVHPHAFRRTFAVYLVRNKLASLLDIKYQFKHMNITMTSWYANQANIASYIDMQVDQELQNEIAGENKNYMTDVFFHIYNEAEILSGHEGKRIKNLRAEGDASIYLSKDEIRRQVEDGRLSLVEHPGGYCTNPYCDRICDMTTCQYKIVTKDKAKTLVNIREKLIIKYNDIESLGLDMPNVTSKLFYEIRAIEQVLSEHHLEYIAFNKKGTY